MFAFSIYVHPQDDSGLTLSPLDLLLGLRRLLCGVAAQRQTKQRQDTHTTECRCRDST